LAVVSLERRSGDLRMYEHEVLRLTVSRRVSHKRTQGNFGRCGKLVLYPRGRPNRG
jgi:hypothetical protein